MLVYNTGHTQQKFSSQLSFTSANSLDPYTEFSIINSSPSYKPTTTVFDTIQAASIKWYASDTGKSLIASGALIGLGLYTYKDNGFLNRVTTKEQINRYLPGFENHLDDYTQWIPYVGIYALDAAGVKSKHSMLRKTTSVGASLLLNLIVIQSLKYSVSELRPDGSARNSFPSGHTATAFMGAHIFHKEYGERSPYYSIGAYVIASVTGFFRQLNDRHWSSDVLVGAGLGISLTELGYYFNELYYGDAHINEIDFTSTTTNYNKPSFLEAKASFATLVDDIRRNNSGLTIKNGFAVDFEGAYFFNKYIGAGGNVGVQSFPVEIDQNIKKLFEAQGFDINSESVGNSKYSLGPFLQYPFGKNTVGAKILVGYSTISDTEIRLSPIEGDVSEADDITYANVSPKGGLILSAGVYFKRLLSDKLYIGLYADYNSLATDLEIRELTDYTNGVPTYQTNTVDSSFDSYNLGGTIGFMIW
jgi:membrane-associated phospholipid phosphatase